MGPAQWHRTAHSHAFTLSKYPTAHEQYRLPATERYRREHRLAGGWAVSEVWDSVKRLLGPTGLCGRTGEYNLSLFQFRFFRLSPLEHSLAFMTYPHIRFATYLVMGAYCLVLWRHLSRSTM